MKESGKKQRRQCPFENSQRRTEDSLCDKKKKKKKKHPVFIGNWTLELKETWPFSRAGSLKFPIAYLIRSSIRPIMRVSIRHRFSTSLTLVQLKSCHSFLAPLRLRENNEAPFDD